MSFPRRRRNRPSGPPQVSKSTWARPEPAAIGPRCASGEVDRAYRRLRAICKLDLAAGLPMVADATFLKRQDRQRFRDLACRMRVPITIVHCEAGVP
ncbi:AAA family ATPase [Ralstonia solanacearum]|uniref:AAA family ATPase n=1 Tax=Ralstonia solanacearum TaxID=305 RepID=UPI0009BEC0F0|nr:AAA family ATPase [Ralstonia solanacearum]